jgi:hypothetical protein
VVLMEYVGTALIEIQDVVRQLKHMGNLKRAHRVSWANRVHEMMQILFKKMFKTAQSVKLRIS